MKLLSNHTNFVSLENEQLLYSTKIYFLKIICFTWLQNALAAP